MLGRDEDLVRTKSRRGSLGSSSYRSLRGASRSFRDVLILPAEDNVCGRSERREEDDVELKWAALERLPTYDRLRKGMLPQQTSVNGKAGLEEVDLTKLAPKEKKHLMEIILKFVEEDNEKFLRRLRERTDRFFLYFWCFFYFLVWSVSFWHKYNIKTKPKCLCLFSIFWMDFVLVRLRKQGGNRSAEDWSKVWEYISARRCT